MTARTRAAWRVTCALAIAAGACAADGERGTPLQRAALELVALPDLTGAADEVQARLTETYALLQSTLDRPDASDVELASAYGEMGRYVLSAEYLDVAESCFANAMALDGRDLRWPYLRGHVRRLANDPAGAALFFERGLAIRPDHVPSLLWLAEMHLTRSEPDAAEPLLARARSLESDSGMVLYGLGRVALARNQHASAVSYLEGALDARPQATRIHYLLGLAYRGLGDVSKAEAALSRRGEGDLTPDDPWLADVAGLLQNAATYEEQAARAIEERRWEDAVESLRAAVALAPANAFNRLNLGTSLYMTGDPAGAMTELQEAVRLSPDLAKAHYSIGVLEQEAGRDPAAIAAFTAALQAEPANVEARLARADALRRTGRVEAALPDYASVLQQDPGASQASFGYAMGLVRLGRYAEARDRLARAASAFPDQPGIAHARARLLAAAPEASVRDGVRALSILDELLKTQAMTLAVAETMAMTMAELGRFDEAMEWQQGAMASAREAGRPDLAERLTPNLRLYEQRRPSRTPWADDDPVHRPLPAAH